MDSKRTKKRPAGPKRRLDEATRIIRIAAAIQGGGKIQRREKEQKR
jgi:hypothetical protein